MSACRGCGKDVVWARLPDGGKIPLDPRPPVYEVSEVTEADPNNPGQVVTVTTATRAPGKMVSHFATCPKASDFSRSKKKT